MDQCKSNGKELIEAKRKLKSNQTELSDKDVEIEELKKNSHRIVEAESG